jgi:hypothetical protein
MLKVDSKRISWFLALRRLLPFPHPSLAPRAWARPAPGPTGLELETAEAYERALQAGAASTTRSVRLPGLTLPGLTQVMPPADRWHIKVLPGRPNMASFKVPRSGLARNVIPDLPLARMPGQDFMNDLGHRIPAVSSIRERYQPIGGSGGMIGGSGRLSNFAPVGNGPATQHAGDIGHYPGSSTVSAGTDGFVPKPDRVPPWEALLSGSDIFSQDQRLAGGQTSATTSTQSRSTRTAVATLHLDGSALGRWTVQHLERVLGKPGSGMTGVDPRASTPRGRVSPF